MTSLKNALLVVGLFVALTTSDLTQAFGSSSTNSIKPITGVGSFNQSIAVLQKASPQAEKVESKLIESRSDKVNKLMGDKGIATSTSAELDLLPAAGEHKKYVLVKKKPKHKKIKMEVYEPKMKYKKIKMKIPVKKYKKKKIKGYLVKKEHGHGHEM